MGIGTTTPAVPLHVNGFARFNGGLQLDGSNRTIYAINNTNLLLGTNNTERMRIDSSGRVGIGTTSPAYKLDIADGASSFRTQLGSGAFYSNDYTMDLSIYSTGGWARGFRVYNTYDNTYSLGIGKTDGYAYFVVDDPDVVDVTLYNSTKGIRVYNNGDVYVGQKLGIGTTSPVYYLDVNAKGDNVAVRFKSTDNRNAILIQDNDTSAFIGVEDNLLYFNRSTK